MLEKLKKLWRFNVVLWIFVLSAACAMSYLFPDTHSATSILGHGLALLVMLLIGLYFIATYVPVTPMTQPIIHVWKVSTVTAVSTDPDYRIACEAIDRRRLTGETPSRTDRWVPAPELTAYFTDNEADLPYLGELFTGNMADFRALAKQCRLRKSEIYVSRFETRRYPVDLYVLYRLLFGEENANKALMKAEQK